MRLSEFIAGVQILQRYYDKPDGFHLGAEHDIIYLFSTDRPVSPADVEAMHDLGWHQEHAQFDDGEWLPKNYDPEESWSAYT